MPSGPRFMERCGKRCFGKLEKASAGMGKLVTTLKERVGPMIMNVETAKAGLGVITPVPNLG